MKAVENGSGREPEGEVPLRPWSLSRAAVAQGVGVEIETGLSRAEARRRLRRFGPNALRRHKTRGVGRILVDQFRSLIILLLVVATAAAFLFGEIVEGWSIFVVVLINALIGFLTELRAVKSMEALRSLGRVTTRVRRDSRPLEVPAESLVPGDVVIIEAGDVVTADLRVVDSSKLQADESVLTGESLPVTKSADAVAEPTPLPERSSLLYQGTAITRGSGLGVVVATGMATELGRISAMVEEAQEQSTPLEQRLEHLGRALIWLTIGITTVIALSGMLRGKDLFLMIETGIALAVASIPEGLPIVATIALARGMHEMAKRNALINRLSSVETLGSASVILTDKTGTLTENRMTVVRLLWQPGERVFSVDEPEIDVSRHAVAREALEIGILCNNAELTGHDVGVGDPLEQALLFAGQRAGIRKERLVSLLPEEREEAFDPEVKMMATFHRQADGYRVAVKGAPESVLQSCHRILTEEAPA